MTAPAPPSRRRGAFGLLLVLVAVVVVGVLVSAAALAPAPPAALPAIVLVCVLCPLAVAPELPAAVGLLRSAGRRRHLAQLRRDLGRLPEVEHPLGL